MGTIGSLSARLLSALETAATGIARDILTYRSCVPAFGQIPAVPVNIMISVSNVSMRYGAKVLFDEVSTAFTPGKRYGLTGPNGASVFAGFTGGPTSKASSGTGFCVAKASSTELPLSQRHTARPFQRQGYEELTGGT